MVMPNFLIIGAHKAGTTSLYNYLKAHPQVYMPEHIKEVRYFSYNESDPSHRAKVSKVFPVTTLLDYERVFQKARSERAIGEASPGYINSPMAARKILATLPEVRLIASLRNPVDRTYSEYLMRVRAGNECRNFIEAFRAKERWVDAGLYAQHLRIYIDLFGLDRIKIIIFDDLMQNPKKVMEDIYNFIGVDQRWVPAHYGKHNPGGIPKYKTLSKLYQNKRLNKIIKRILPFRAISFLMWIKERNLQKMELNNDERREILEYFINDILELEEMLGVDLKHWRDI